MPVESPIFQIIAAASLGPAIWAAWTDRPQGSLFGGLLALAVIGPVLWCLMVLQSGWRTDFSFTVWVSAAATLVVFAVVAARSEPARRLSILILPYLLFLVGFAIVSNNVDRHLGESPGAWIITHILIAVTTYGLLTLAAVAGLAVFVKERALKSRRPTVLATLLPSVAEGEQLQDRLMLACEVVLGLGLVTGIAIHVQRGQPLLEPDHKTLLTLAAFAVIGLLLLLQRYSGLRGRRAARIVMIAYLLVTLAYPGVKFVTDVLSG